MRIIETDDDSNGLGDEFCDGYGYGQGPGYGGGDRKGEGSGWNYTFNAGDGLDDKGYGCGVAVDEKDIMADGYGYNNCTGIGYDDDADCFDEED